MGQVVHFFYNMLAHPETLIEFDENSLRIGNA
jgi:hypothetical protein